MAHERRRAANRLRDAWKKDPWLHGATLDLGEHEPLFRDEVAVLGHDVDRMPPGVVDTARWRFRRAMVDRSRGADWRTFVHEVLPVLLRKAGAPSDGWEPVAEGDVGAPPAFVVPALKIQGTKRQIPDAPRAAPAPRETKIQIVKPPSDTEAVALSALVLEHREWLVPLLARLENDSQRTRLLRAFRDRLANGNDGRAVLAWGAVLRDLGLGR